MDSALLLVIGLALGALSLPSLFSAIVDGRPPRAGAVALVLAAGLVALALHDRPGGFRLAEIPQIVSRVVGRLLH